MKSALVIIDFSHLIYSKCYYLSQVLEKTLAIEVDEKNSNILLNSFISSIGDIVKSFKQYNCDVLICLDSNKQSKSWRYNIYPNYKLNRRFVKQNIFFGTAIKHAKTDEFNNKLFEAFESKGYNYYRNEIVEADDVLYIAIKKYIHNYDCFKIISEDGDITQLKLYFNNSYIDIDGKKVSDNRIKIYDIACKELIKPDDQVYMNNKIISGDSGDNIINIGSTYKHNDKFFSWLRTMLLKSGNKRVFSDIELDKFINSKSIYDRNKIYDMFYNECNKAPLSKKNVVKTKLKDLDMPFNKLDERIKETYDDEIYKKYLFNKKLVLFENIPLDIQEQITNELIIDRKITKDNHIDLTPEIVDDYNNLFE